MFRRLLIDTYRSYATDTAVSHTRRKLHNVANNANNSGAAATDLNDVIVQICYCGTLTLLPSSTKCPRHDSVRVPSCFRDILRFIAKESFFLGREKNEKKNPFDGDSCGKKEDATREEFQASCSLFTSIFQTG